MFRVEVVLLLAGLCAVGSAIRAQSVAVKGNLVCHGRPYANGQVKLYEKDRISKDDLLAEVKTDSRGYFEISGTQREWLSIRPKITIVHACDTRDSACEKKFDIEIEKKYVSSGSTPTKFWNAGNIELALDRVTQTTDCKGSKGSKH
uniref:Transthyretin-like family protein n=1 Tax=Panagrellus redivivus TaxID=6233 RepID=A0A7E4VFT0_PANRE